MSVKFLSRQTLPLVHKAGVRRNGGLWFGDRIFDKMVLAAMK
jgi:hypothetical protein